jgi:hypothetical protein
MTDQNDRIQLLSLLKRLENAEQLFIDGYYEKSHHERINALSDLAEKKYYHHLKTKSESAYQKFPQFFSYAFFNLMALKELEHFEEMIVRGEGIFEQIIFDKKFFEDIKKDPLEIIETLENLAPHLENIIQCHVWQIWCETAKIILNKKESEKKQLKHLAELIIWKPSTFHFKLAILCLAINKDKNKSQKIFQEGRKRKVINYPDLIKNHSWLKDILLSEISNDLAKVKKNTENNEETKVSHKKRADYGLTFERLDIDYEKMKYNLEVEDPKIEMYPDLIISFMSMNAWELVEYMIKKSHKIEKDFEVSKKIKYLEALFRLETEDYFLVLSLCEELRAMSSTLDELIELDYMEGNIYRKMNNPERALFYFRRVQNQNQNYRLIKDRIKEIEKN